MQSLATLAVAILITAGTASAVAAAEPACRRSVEAMSSVQKSLTPAYDNVTPADIKRSYDRAFATGRRQALNAWKAKVTSTCPHNSDLWLRATAQSIAACDQAMGGRFSVCVSAKPGAAILRRR